MAGMLDTKKEESVEPVQTPVQEGAEGEAAPEGGGNSKLTPEALEAQMHLQPAQRKQLDRVVTAGLKVMFSKQSHQMMLKQLEGPQPMGQKIGQGVAGLVALLFQESRHSIPPNLLVPAGVILCAHAVQWLRQAGEQVTDQDLGEAIDTMTSAVLSASGVNPDKMANAADRMGQAGAQPMPPEGAAAAPAGAPMEAAP